MPAETAAPPSTSATDSGVSGGESGLPFVVLAGLFTGALVTCNLIANKFVEVQLPLFSEPFRVSAGILPYPLTFLVTDLLSEIYGKRKANQVVLSGFAASLLALLAIALGQTFPALEASPVGDDQFATVFGNAWRVIGASMLAYLCAQFLDVRMFHFWKDLTKGKHLWLRNNASTVGSQLLDTTLVVSVLFICPWDPEANAYGNTDWGFVGGAILDGFTFKVLVALVDTPLFYLGVWLFRRHLPREGEVHTFGA